MSATYEVNGIGSLWIFGYGSLLWKVNFPYQDKVVGHVKGYTRRFWQGSTDHRGTPGAPGRVVTLIEQAQECTWGVAYKVDPKDVVEIMDYLNHREKDGYVTKELIFYPKQGLELKPFTVLLYIGSEANPMYLGPAPLSDIAKQVISSVGPSGCNTEYVLNLAQAMHKIAPDVDDSHLFSLEGQIREMLGERGRRIESTTTSGGLSDGLGDKGREQEYKCSCMPCIMQHNTPVST